MTLSELPDREEVARAVWPEGRKVPKRIVLCRHCGRKNRVEVPRAVTWPESYQCGACSKDLFLGKDTPLEGLASIAYQHSLDKRSLSALRSVPGAPQFVRWSLEQVGDRTARVMFMSDAILCNEEQFPELLSLADRARRQLGMKRTPTIFLGESPHMNALTTGV
jgi:hypothetical protein